MDRRLRRSKAAVVIRSMPGSLDGGFSAVALDMGRNPRLMIPFAVRIIVIPALALAAAIGAFVYFRATEKPPAVATAPQSPPPARTGASPPPIVQSAPPQSTAALPERPSGGAGAPAAGTKPPEFDIVRVTPSGETVVAGRAPGAARVELLDQGKVIAGEKVDQNGQFVLLPPSLSGGDHLLALRVTPEGQPPVSSNQSVAVAVRPGTSPVVTLAEPGKPSVVLAAPDSAAVGAPGQKPSDIAAAPTSGQVTIRTAEVEAGGRFFATGTAPPGSTVRLYLNGSHVADAGAASDGKWSLTIERGVTGGKYALRADAVGEQGKVLSRAEVPFDAPVAVAGMAPTPATAPAAAPPAASRPVANPSSQRSASSGEPAGQPAARPGGAVAQALGGTPLSAAPAAPPQSATSAAASNATANPVIAEISTAAVTRGDSLWRISRLRLGKGTRYTIIYEANASQIRNPNLIYPGQVLVMPQN
jgi:nucleoid-associated protein YgaU